MDTDSFVGVGGETEGIQIHRFILFGQLGSFREAEMVSRTSEE